MPHKKLLAGNRTQRFFQDNNILSYEEVQAIARTVHLDDFKGIHENQDFLHTPVEDIHGTRLKLSHGGVWFRGVSVSESLNPHRHDWFGNVRLDIKTKDVIKNIYNYYLIDLAIYSNSCASRVLITTNKSYPNSRKLNLNNLSPGDPMRFDELGNLLMAKSLKTPKQIVLEHHLHFILDTTINTRDLFAGSQIVPVNHSIVNRRDPHTKLYRAHQCLNYNGGKKIDCPFNNTYAKTRCFLKHKYNIDVLFVQPSKDENNNSNKQIKNNYKLTTRNKITTDNGTPHFKSSRPVGFSSGGGPVRPGKLAMQPNTICSSNQLSHSTPFSGTPPSKKTNDKAWQTITRKKKNPSKIRNLSTV